MLKTRLSWKKAKSYHDRPAHPLPPLEVGQEVRLVPLKKAKNWQSGSLVEQLSDGSYLVKTENETIRQYGYYLKPKEKPATNVVPEVSPDVAKELPVTAALNGK